MVSTPVTLQQRSSVASVLLPAGQAAFPTEILTDMLHPGYPLFPPDVVLRRGTSRPIMFPLNKSYDNYSLRDLQIELAHCNPAAVYSIFHTVPRFQEQIYLMAGSAAGATAFYSEHQQGFPYLLAAAVGDFKDSLSRDFQGLNIPSALSGFLLSSEWAAVDLRAAVNTVSPEGAKEILWGKYNFVEEHPLNDLDIRRMLGSLYTSEISQMLSTNSSTRGIVYRNLISYRNGFFPLYSGMLFLRAAFNLAGIDARPTKEESFALYTAISRHLIGRPDMQIINKLNESNPTLLAAAQNLYLEALGQHPELLPLRITAAKFILVNGQDPTDVIKGYDPIGKNLLKLFQKMN